jgi:hypothetical protein
LSIYNRVLYAHAAFTAAFGGLCAVAIQTTPWAPMAVVPFVFGMAALVPLAVHLKVWWVRESSIPVPLFVDLPAHR